MLVNLFLPRLQVSTLTGNKFLTTISQNRGNLYIKSTKKNIFCSLLDPSDNKIKTSCSIKVVKYDNEFNERINLFKRGVLLGQLFADKILSLGYKEVFIYLDSGINKGRKGVLKGLSQKIKISYISLAKTYPHNGCRPPKSVRKKIRTKHKGF